AARAGGPAGAARARERHGRGEALRPPERRTRERAVRMTDRRQRIRRPSAVALALAAGLAGELALHFLEPRLALTWSYAHLGRRAALPWLGIALVLALPAAGRCAWRQPGVERPLGAVSWRSTLGGCALLGAAVRPWLDAPQVIRTVSGLAASVALVALAGAARRLGRTRGEAGAITLLAWSAFGTAQLVPGYLDVYPFALAVTALYLCTALGALAGDVHPGWPLALAFVAPFFYIGLVLLLPSTAVIALSAARRPEARAPLALGLLAAVAAAGAATLPGFGAPFAWRAFVARAHA